MLWDLAISASGAAYTLKKDGPKTEPWGTPYFSSLTEDKELSTLTVWDLLFKYVDQNDNKYFHKL